MGVRNCQELGENLQKIFKRLLANDDLVKLLYYEGQDPLGSPALTEEEKKEKVFKTLIKMIPNVGTKDTAKSVIVVYVQKATKLAGNNDFKNVKILVDVIVPLEQWVIKDSNLRPFAIMGQIQESLDGKTINGLGRISGGEFELSFITDDVSCYQQVFEIIEYD